MNDMSSLSGRKRLDEYHLKILRELLTSPPNKHCFDCHQRGPTYVNVTIGSFVCTTCSGMLRGLTPPHRVKSVTMATFSPEEMELIKTRGNEYCKKIWLGLYDSEVPTKDEQQIKDFMISKYEKKRYYIDPSTLTMMNGSTSSVSSNSSSATNSPSNLNLFETSSGKNNQKILNSQKSRPNAFPTTIKNNLHFGSGVNNSNDNYNNNSNGIAVGNNQSSSFITDFSSPSSTSDPFNSSLESSSNSELSFADFENNPVFCSSQTSFATDWLNYGNSYNNNVNTSTTIQKDIIQMVFNSNGKPINPVMRPLSVPVNKWRSDKDFGSPANTKETVVEDKYAALKDLDCMMKSQMLEKQKQQMLQQTLCNGKIWPNIFPAVSNGTVSEPVTPFNPFANGWNENNQWSLEKNFAIGPISNTAITATSNGVLTTNGNPFKINGLSKPNGQHHSSNPFL